MKSQSDSQPAIILSLSQNNVRLKVTDSKVTPRAVAFVKKHKQELIQILEELTPVTDSNHSIQSRLVSPQEQIDRLVEQFGVLGAQVGFYKAGKESCFFSGVCDSAKMKAFTSEHKFRLSCLTKVVVCYAALRLVDQGKFILDEPIALWTPVTFPKATGLSLRHLLSHSAGFDETAFRYLQSKNSCLSDFVRNMSQYEQMMLPGEGYIYSSSSIILVAHLLELVCQKNWIDAVDELVFKPLGIELVKPHLAKANSYIRSAASAGYERQTVQESEPVFEPAAATSIELSVSDLLKLAAVPIEKGKLANGKQFLSVKLANLLLKESTIVEGNYFITGFGFGWLSFPGYGLYGFISGNQGQHTCVIINMNLKQAIAAQCITQPNFEFFNLLCSTFFKADLLKEHAIPQFNTEQILGEYEAQGLTAKVYKQVDQIKVSVKYLDESGTWSNPVESNLVDSGMGDYFAAPKIYPLIDSINFHDLNDSGDVTHIRITQKLCKKQKSW